MGKVSFMWIFHFSLPFFFLFLLYFLHPQFEEPQSDTIWKHSWALPGSLPTFNKNKERK